MTNLDIPEPSDIPEPCGESGCICYGEGEGHANCACGCDCPADEWRPGECDNCYGGDENGITASGALGFLYRERMALNDVLARAEERTAARLQEAAGVSSRRAWCFDHGRLRVFAADAPWCTARWVWLDGGNDALAMQDKRLRYGEAQFLHQLTDAQQLAIIRECADRRERSWPAAVHRSRGV